MRLLTGLLFGLGVAWFSLPYLEKMIREYWQKQAIWRLSYRHKRDKIG
jgi:hypothetical protein